MNDDRLFPSVPSSVTPQERIFLNYIRDRIMRLLGRSLDRAVTYRDLVDFGLVDQSVIEKRLKMK